MALERRTTEDIFAETRNLQLNEKDVEIKWDKEWVSVDSLLKAIRNREYTRQSLLEELSKGDDE